MSRLETVLASLTESMDWPEPSEHLATRVSARIRSRRLMSTPPRWAVALVVAALLMIVGLFPGPRQAVADLLEEAGVRIGFLDPSTEVANLDLGEPMAVETAVERVGFALREPEILGPPEGAYLDGGAAILVWEGPILLSQRSSDEPFAEKRLGSSTEVTSAQIDGQPGIWIEGAEHSFTLLDPSGKPIEETTRLAANVLLWSDDGIDYRLELNGTLDEALAIATSLEEFPR